jgi:hypothetical protein
MPEEAPVTMTAPRVNFCSLAMIISPRYLSEAHMSMGRKAPALVVSVVWEND